MQPKLFAKPVHLLITDPYFCNCQLENVGPQLCTVEPAPRTSFEFHVSFIVRKGQKIKQCCELCDSYFCIGLFTSKREPLDFLFIFIDWQARRDVAKKRMFYSEHIHALHFFRKQMMLQAKLRLYPITFKKQHFGSIIGQMCQIAPKVMLTNRLPKKVFSSGN